MENIPFSSSAELAKLSVEIAGAARRQLDIISRSLEPVVYDSQDFIDAAKALALTPRGHVRILLLDPETVLSRGEHRLLNLAMRVSSHMEIRRLGPDHQEFNEAMLIADRHAAIHRQLADRYEGVANFHAPLWALQLSETFETIWQNAEPDPHFRRLML